MLICIQETTAWWYRESEYYTCTKRHHDNLKTQIKRTFAPFSHLLYHITPYREMFKYILFKNDITNGIWLIVEKDRSKAFAAKKKRHRTFWMYMRSKILERFFKVKKLYTLQGRKVVFVLFEDISLILKLPVKGCKIKAHYAWHRKMEF